MYDFCAYKSGSKAQVTKKAITGETKTVANDGRESGGDQRD